MDFSKKYLKYKGKYINLKNQKGGAVGGPPTIPCTDINVNSCYIKIYDTAGNTFNGINGTSIITDPLEPQRWRLGMLNGKTLEEFLRQLCTLLIVPPIGQIIYFENLREDLIQNGLINGRELTRPLEELATRYYNETMGTGIAGPKFLEIYFRDCILPYLPPNLSYLIEDNYALNVKITPAADKNLADIGGQRKGRRSNTTASTCEEGEARIRKNWDETPEECIRRETEEEIGIDLNNLCDFTNLTPLPAGAAIPAGLTVGVLYYEFEPVNIDPNGGCCRKIYHLRINNAQKLQIIQSYNLVRGKTEIFFGKFGDIDRNEVRESLLDTGRRLNEFRERQRRRNQERAVQFRDFSGLR